MGRVVLVDEREPLTLTSDKGTQAYRNWWPGPDATMLRYMMRSIDVMEEMAEESGNVFRLNRRGYLFVTADSEELERLRTTAETVSSFGMGPIRTHPGPDRYAPAPAEGYRDQPIGADLLLGDEARRAFPYLSPDVKGALHVRRAGWQNGVALGSWMIKRALAAGASFVRDRMTSVDTKGGRIREVRLASGDVIATERLVIAAGPLVHEAGRLLGLELPVFHELHAKVTFRDPRGAVGRAAPLLIWNDPVELPWSDEERVALQSQSDSRRLLQPFPAGVHVRPVDGPHGDELYLIWTYHTERVAPEWPPRFDPHYSEVLLRGASRMLPMMKAYFAAGARGFVDGGYYCKTRENRPLAGPLPVDGAYVLAGLSGFGLMGAHAGADLVALHLTGAPLPDYAHAMLPSRYDDPGYQAQMERWGALVGQL